MKKDYGEVESLEECLLLLEPKRPFLKEPKININDCVQPFTKSGDIAYEKLRSIIVFLCEQNIIENFDEDLLDNIANSKHY